MTTIIRPETAAFTATVEFRDAQTHKAFEWITVEQAGNNPTDALIQAQSKAQHNAIADADTKLLSQLRSAEAVIIQVNQQWDATGRAL